MAAPKDLWQINVEQELRRIDSQMETMAGQMTVGFESALRKVLSDPQVTTEFWRRGYEELTNHASNNASQWVGKRILVALVVALTGAAIVWLVKNGAIK